ncbi:hypothetical protein ACFQWB_04365 [Paenibacillus thermoaerophilus]|uniref:Uncharacterized protein n=1 Tax=Paenibacillus thermoaerophilus TaxID=1215385 RepID=A0ABW2V102_9BACL|nr:hypothetical protein [Paenibacillus thermoaerophilus]TMV17477.1 hypothetical protein FE781_07040 [Paenibacillus thermoaerophilus]
MTTKSVSADEIRRPSASNVMGLVRVMTAMAWGVLAIGLVLCLFNLGHFSDRNVGLMVGLGFLVGSVHIYVIGTAIGLVHARMHTDEPSAGGQ